jgi:hypothetical protein
MVAVQADTAPMGVVDRWRAKANWTARAVTLAAAAISAIPISAPAFAFM